jgi:hypothetical protein
MEGDGGGLRLLFLLSTTHGENNEVEGDDEGDEDC